MKLSQIIIPGFFLVIMSSFSVAAQDEASPKVRALVQDAFDCEERGDDRCALEKYRQVLRERDLPLSIREMVQDRQVLNLSGFISDHGESISHEEYWSICQEGIGLLKSQGRDEGLEALQFYIRGAIINHEMGAHPQKRLLLKGAKEAMSQSGRWSEIEGYQVSAEVRREGIRWAQRVIDQLD